MPQSWGKRLTNHVLNVPGWRTKRKIVVIESDDWGSIRMPSFTTYERLKKEGFHVDRDVYLKYDSLASETDLSRLFEVLRSVKDKNGHPAIITANTIVANPDFERIRQADFQEYFYEPFTATLSRYPHHANSFKLWKEGVAEGIFRPQFHGREHLNVYQWMRSLRNDEDNIKTAFDNQMISISSEPLKLPYGYMESLDYYSEEERKEKGDILKEGLLLFEKTFGYKSRSFIANCYVWDKAIESDLKEEGVQYLQGVLVQKQPRNKNQFHDYRHRYHFQGEQNKLRQRYLVRNAFFEPSHRSYQDDVSECLRRMEIAFFWQKPVVISTHRVNFIGCIDQKNADRTFTLFRELLSRMVQRWPDIEFLSSDRLGEIMDDGLSYGK
ncbi:hypothetical protein RT717_20010 [Imperialibacter roseus]|uniref:Polysaccharide (De)acetylase n=1 Tax=Imperialibacter roseus TaxID=1324217 RepID=A0ABZ0IMI2_9BACT|nr:hypothetical protein [Imperialibacter roseus]WOK05369.1 hypothetical protein RT717_20010 [Imperialibacter roseus]